jgi:hypothetical protein
MVMRLAGLGTKNDCDGEGKKQFTRPDILVGCLVIEVSSSSVHASHPFIWRETDPVSEKLCCLEYRTMNKVQKLSNPNK